VDFTREPIIETVVIPRDGYRIAVRNSKASGQEEFFVEALEIVTIGGTCFFRNREKPTPFMVPATDYEIVEVRDPRLGLKVASFESTFKSANTRVRIAAKEEERVEKADKESKEETAEQSESRPEKRKEKKKSSRRKKKDEVEPKAEAKTEAKAEEKVEPKAEYKSAKKRGADPVEETVVGFDSKKKEKSVDAALSVNDEKNRAVSLLPPPTTLIRDELDKLRKSDEYKDAFYTSEDQESKQVPSLEAVMSEEPLSSEPPLYENMYMATPAPSEDEIG